MPILNVFVRDGQGIRHHSWATELMFAPRDEREEPRHVDSIWPIWSVLDMTRKGEGRSRTSPGWTTNSEQERRARLLPAAEGSSARRPARSAGR